MKLRHIFINHMWKILKLLRNGLSSLPGTFNWLQNETLIFIKINSLIISAINLSLYFIILHRECRHMQRRVKLCVTIWTIVIIGQYFFIPKLKFSQMIILILIFWNQLINLLHKLLSDINIGKILAHRNKLSDTFPNISKFRQIFFGQESHQYHPINVDNWNFELVSDRYSQFIIRYFVDNSIQHFMRRMHKYFTSINCLILL